MIPPTYKSSTTVMVNLASTETINLNDIMTSERLAKTYAEVISKRTVLESVIKEVNLDTDYEELLKKVDVQLVRDTQLITISVKAKDAEIAAQIADTIAQKFSEEVIKLQGDKQSYNTIATVEKAFPSEKPDSPKKALSISLAFILSFISIIGIIFLIEYLDDTFKDEFDIKEYLNLPHLGTVSYIKEVHRRAGNLITTTDPHDPIVESFREIRTNVQFSQPDKPTKAFVVTSSGPSEGKSQITANLAVIMAQAGYKTILIDADLHRPTQHDIFKVENNFGLTDVLTKNDLPKTIWESTQINGLSLITSGSFLPNPAEWLGSTKMYHLIERLKEAKFHTIIFDTPPIGLITDAAIISSMVDGAILVVESGKTTRTNAQKAVEAIKKVGGEIIGTILNNKKPNGDKKSHYYRYSEHKTKN
ncbi:hypothetical protein A2X44_04965 [candidate division CPR3 bacterium GWF2_35_18]|nr:MAG: hypothetical protein A2X44_04965 [candidate division CPR3 bacterium GWF2_35_18]OGB64995.1 MAG: hypothetical protein A2250_01080 [candidate division CPR3 bacterium RIFOXYA2_FULL_35_13]OGB79726.1 MAG: hypothetical protein A2011_02630 [candidate division CPR3 bacterium GWE2_35_7]